jgi:hypothetical protein
MFVVNSIDITTVYTIQKRMTGFMTGGGKGKRSVVGNCLKKFAFLHASKYLI